MTLNYNRGRHVALFFLLAGFCFYLLSAASSSVFIVSVPMADDWCLEWDETYEACLEFKNSFERRKYHHSKEMVNRNKILMSLQFGLAFAVTGLLFHLIPKWKGHRSDAEPLETLVVIGILTFLVSIVAPLAFSILLPPPVEWFPQVFREISDAQTQEALRRLR